MGKPQWRMIPYVDAADFPSQVEDWCEAHGISTHYQNDVAYIEDDGNPMAEWLKELGIPKPEKRDDIWVIAIAAT